MNFTAFGNHFPPGTIPTATLHQFGTKFAHNAGGQMLSVIGGSDGAVQYIRQVDPHGFTVATAQGTGNNQHPQVQQALITLPFSISGKPGEPDQQQQTVQIQVVNPNQTLTNNGTANNGAPKYHISPLSLHHFPQGVLTVAYTGQQQTDAETVQLQVQHPQIQVTQASEESPQSQDISNNNSSSNNNNNSSNTQNHEAQVSVQTEPQTITVTTGDKQDQHQQTFPVTVVALQPQDLILRDAVTAVELAAAKSPHQDGSGSKDNTVQVAIVKTECEKDTQGGEEFNGTQHASGSTVTTMPSTWQSLVTPGSTVADYLSRLPAATLPLNLHQFLKFSAETIKREAAIESSPLSNPELVDASVTAVDPLAESPTGVEAASGKPKRKKKYKKKPPKPRRPRPGQVLIATALDGTTLFCCPECHMAYPEKELLEQHLVGHKIERRFICDICGAGLKRKEHLERHKLGHNPDRPYICTVCLKGFKRKEHLNLHFVIHSGEKSEVCPEMWEGILSQRPLEKACT
ncbi:hypothetical protein L9F63_017310 [Diploptera punctata]|uniref:C2H2-type domain-containing protein n=1 Tax=Diploptera punctata TaxID=6984 RepID=A0AAD8A105_DIPPU|nr:hypothetical protein L9F63_017310 [Diploptera punctata]